jgi:HK97 family phage major capsid protein
MNLKTIDMKYLYIPFILFLLAACGSQEETTQTAEQENDAKTSEEVQANEVEEEMDDQPEKIVKVSTPMGDMLIKLYNNTPRHRDNFIKLANEGFFNDLMFHRVMNGFMIQGGDPESKTAQKGAPLGKGGPGYTVPAEFKRNLIHKKGALAAARQPDQVNPTKASSGSQFYIVQGKQWTDEELAMISQRAGIQYTEEEIETYKTLGGYPPLDMQYTVFGEVIDGMEVIDKIAAVATDQRDRPLEDIRMTVTVEED